MVFDARTQGLINNLAGLMQGWVDPTKAKHRVVYDLIKDDAHDVEYGCAFEIIAVPVRVELLEQDPTGFASRFVGAINYSTAPKGNKFEGTYRWSKDKKTAYYTYEASDVEDVLSEYDFEFTKGRNRQKSKLPCIIYGNLISSKLNYIGQSKTEVDITPFANLIIKAVKSIARDIPTFRSAEIRTPDYHTGSSGGSYHFSYSRTRPVKETIERKSMSDIIYERLKDRITRAQAGIEWTGEMHTQQSLWYNSLALIRQYVESGQLKKPKNRNNFLDQIRVVCDEHGVTRESVGIVAAAYSNMFYRGRWSPVNFADIKTLAANGTDIIFIEKEDIVQSLGRYASGNGVALVNSKGQLSQYAKDLSQAAKSSNAHIGILTDYDIPGLHIASKLPDAVWLGVDEPMLRHFGISHENMDYVIPYDPERAIGDEVIKRDILSDPRFKYPRTDVEWLKRHFDPTRNTWDPGNKVEIDAVLSVAGAKKLWEYLKVQMRKAHEKRDYRRAIDAYKNAPMPGLVGFTNPQIVGLVQMYIRKRAESITEQKRQQYHDQLKEYHGFLNVQDKENEIRKELSNIVNTDQQLGDLTSAMHEAAGAVERTIIETITTALEELDEEKGYGILDSIEKMTREGGART